MNIKSISGLLGAYQAQINRVDKDGTDRVRETGAERAKKPVLQTDRVSVSADASLRTAAMQAAAEAPDMRLEKMETIRQSLEDNTYVIDNRKIAAKIIAEERALFEG